MKNTEKNKKQETLPKLRENVEDKKEPEDTVKKEEKNPQAILPRL